jgi:hypothetical protein
LCNKFTLISFHVLQLNATTLALSVNRGFDQHVSERELAASFGRFEADHLEDYRGHLKGHYAKDIPPNTWRLFRVRSAKTK